MRAERTTERLKTYRPHKGKRKDRRIISIHGEVSIRDGRAGDVQLCKRRGAVSMQQTY